MTKVQFRRWVVHLIEKAIMLTIAMVVMCAGCIVVALVMGGLLNLLGVAT